MELLRSQPSTSADLHLLNVALSSLLSTPCRAVALCVGGSFDLHFLNSEAFQIVASRDDQRQIGPAKWIDLPVTAHYPKSNAKKSEYPALTGSAAIPKMTVVFQRLNRYSNSHGAFDNLDTFWHFLTSLRAPFMT